VVLKENYINKIENVEQSAHTFTRKKQDPNNGHCDSTSVIANTNTS